jgi:hypothetical protein|eukprot:SAG25_NODE_427_length_8159_cov_9.134491_6_plen_61_part_00
MCVRHPIPALIIGGQDGGEAVFLQAELHAREWITPSTVGVMATPFPPLRTTPSRPLRMPW